MTVIIIIIIYTPCQYLVEVRQAVGILTQSLVLTAQSVASRNATKLFQIDDIQSADSQTQALITTEHHHQQQKITRSLKHHDIQKHNTVPAASTSFTSYW